MFTSKAKPLFFVVQPCIFSYLTTDICSFKHLVKRNGRSNGWMDTCTQETTSTCFLPHLSEASFKAIIDVSQTFSQINDAAAQVRQTAKHAKLILYNYLPSCHDLMTKILI